MAGHEDHGAFGQSRVADAPTIEGYTIERELGRGGEAIVYLAREQRSDRRVAIKVLRPELAASLHSERFVQEVGILSELVHPNILPLLHSGRAGEALYYVSPYVEGESLRSRLAREGQLPIPDAVRIVQQVAYAIDYAWRRRGIVHRDLKPENILLADGHAFVADFGVAHALNVAAGQRVTVPGLAVGTPPYMSPEQAGAEERIDGRSDIYSLGCVLYELLAGSPPFEGATPQNVLRKHLAAPVPSLRIARSTVPEELEAVVQKALEKSPADRYASAAELADALGALRSAPKATPWARRAVIAGTAAAIVATAFLMAKGVGAESEANETSPAGGGPDTSRYVVIALDSGAGVTVGEDAVDELVRDALKRWSDITVVEQREAHDAVADSPTAVSAEAARAAARRLNSGRLVRLQVASLAGSVRLHAALVHTASGAVLLDTTVHLPRSGAGVEENVARLTDHLLLGGAALPRRAGTPVSRSLRAQQAYMRGHADIEEWDLAAAASEFRTARDADPAFVLAGVWLAQVELWRRVPIAQWQGALERAMTSQAPLASADSLRLVALAASAEGASDRACATFGRLVALDVNESTSHISLGHCLARDSAVIRDPRSPTGWAFRTSYRRALESYQRAFRLHPAIHQSFRGGSTEEIRRLFRTNRNEVRLGLAAPPDTLTFMAYPSWTGDTLSFIPIPSNQFRDAHRWVSSDAVTEAVRRQRLLFHDVATRWRAALPRSPDALEAVAVGLDMLGNRSALDSLHAARRLVTDDDDRVRIAALEVWMRVKLSAPNDINGLRDAGTLADSLLRQGTAADPATARRLAPLAALRGRAAEAGRFNRVAEATQFPAAVAHALPALVAYAAIGGPGDTVRALEGEVHRALRTTLRPGERITVRSQLARAALLALPDLDFDSIPGLDSTGSGALLRAWHARDRAAVRRIVEARGSDRREGMVRAPEVTLDALRAEAGLLAAVGDTARAADWLAPTLDSLALAAPQTLANVGNAGSLVRAMVLRATVAAQLGDVGTARRWALAVAALWSAPDPVLVPTVDRMRVIGK